MKTKKYTSSATPFLAPSRDQISQRARELWENAGRPADRDLEHWLEAERQLRDNSGLRDDARRLTASPNDPASSDAAEVDQEIDRIGGRRAQRSATSL